MWGRPPDRLARTRAASPALPTPLLELAKASFIRTKMMFSRLQNDRSTQVRRRCEKGFTQRTHPITTETRWMLSLGSAGPQNVKQRGQPVLGTTSGRPRSGDQRDEIIEPETASCCQWFIKVNGRIEPLLQFDGAWPMEKLNAGSLLTNAAPRLLPHLDPG
jgi:hypothetical protein